MENIEIIKIIGVALVTAITSIILKVTKPELSSVTLITGGIIILMMICDALKETVALLENISSMAGIDGYLIKIIIKIIGVGYLVEFSASLINDMGFVSLSNKLIFAGKIVVLLLSIPIIEGVFGVVNSLVKLI